MSRPSAAAFVLELRTTRSLEARLEILRKVGPDFVPQVPPARRISSGLFGALLDLANSPVNLSDVSTKNMRL